MVIQKIEQNSNSIGFIGLLTIVLVVLKATGFIDWSWWFVWLPIYIFPALLAFGAAAFGTFMLVITVHEHFEIKRRQKKRDGF